MGDIKATVFIGAGTEYTTFDWPRDDGGRTVGLEFDGLTIQIAGWVDRDASIVAATGALIDQLDKLRTAAARRIADANVEMTDWAPGELAEAFGK